MARRVGMIALLMAALALHQDLWLWNDDARVAGLPVGLAYHVAYCLAVTVALAGIVRFAWPVDLEADDE